MKHYFHPLNVLAGLSLVAILVIPFAAFAATPAQPTITAASQPDVYITEVQTASAASSGEEFVEFYNATDKDIDLSDSTHSGKVSWKLQYFLGTKFTAVAAANAPATAWTSPSGTISLTGTIPAHDYYVLASTTSSGAYAPGSIDADQTYSPHLSDEAALQLVDVPTTNNFVTHDRLLWTTDTTKRQANSQLYGAPVPGSSLQRLPTADLTYDRADDTLTDFAAEPIISPRAAWVEPQVPAVDDPVDPTVPTGPEPGDGSAQPPVAMTNDGLVSPIISELLPNPAAPLTDATDEYIELYNPNDTAYNLAGLTLESGDTTKHDFTFSDGVLPAASYVAFYASTTGIPLSNSSGKVVLLNAAGTVLSTTAPYSVANDGQAWAYDLTTDSWQWTTAQTPGAANVFIQPATAATKKATVTASKKTATKVKGTSTVKKAKVAKAKKTKKTKASTAPVAYNASSTAAPVAPIHTSVLAVVASLAVAYVIYEYRRDLANKIQQLRSYRGARSRNRP